MIRGGEPYRAGPVAWAFILAAVCLILFLFQKILWLVVPFVLALIIYYVLQPLKSRLQLGGMAPDAAAGWVAGGSFAAIAALAMLAFPAILAEAVGWQATAVRYVEGGLRLLVETLNQLESSVSLLAQAHVSETVNHQIAEQSEHFAERYLAGFALTLAAWAPSLLLAPFLAFFMLRDGWRFKSFIGRGVPNAFFERTLYLLDQVDRTARLYFVGLIQLTLLDALCLALGLWMIGVSAPIALGIMTAILAWVPFIGSILGCTLVVLVAATDFPSQPQVAYGAIVLFVVVRLLDDFVFMPMTIGKSLNIHPLLTVMMIFVGGAVAGVPGLMLALPVLGVAMVFGETIGAVITDPRLQARHRLAIELRKRLATVDL